jgi:hypothetical protein
VEDAAAASDERRYSLSPRHVEALLDESNLNYIAPIERLMGAYTRPVDALMDAFRSSADVPLARHRASIRRKADLESFEVLPIENDFYHFYR